MRAKVKIEVFDTLYNLVEAQQFKLVDDLNKHELGQAVASTFHAAWAKGHDATDLTVVVRFS